MSSHTLWIVIEPGRYWHSHKISAIKRKKPNLKDHQATVKIEVEIPQTIFDPPRAAIVIKDENVIRPVPKAQT